MEGWAEKTIAILDKKTEGTKQRDLRFYRVDELKRNIRRAGDFSTNCSFCKKEKKNIDDMVKKADEAIHVPGQSRRKYDRLIGRLASHMQKEHGFFTPYYFSYLFSFFGMVIGLLAGYFLMKLFPAHDWALLSAGFIAGLATGYFLGTRKDYKIRSAGKLM